ncbi:MAG: NAD(P)-binding domain-containing protein [Ignavibacteriaceae bacterium]|nr:NAD(P)-binding domain-containing protein [Ignavibacteriaceae bacterium]MCW8816421.1 NAD(P)-binding domain-containing protein [Ignavibacteriaceae bacterium]MCW8960825.1 NAD(P)-binding domain-containing protein [Ignavibacteriaceae bacterium]MCW8995486.1 NAD(P)-binding domain-containing protein [Psychromonas sp.]
MEVFIENIATYVLVIGFIGLLFYFYIKKHKKHSIDTVKKIEKAKELGFHEPVSLHPVVNPDICIGSAACIAVCPEHDILGLVEGRATTINASRCVGHGACFHACPVQAITLCIGTEKRGVELPHISEEFETTIPGIYIAGELGGMGLIKNAVEQGKQAMSYIASKLKSKVNAKFDVVIVGSGPAGISATLEAAKRNLKFVTLEQNTLGGTVSNFPRAKVVMTSPMDLPLYGKIKLTETSKLELLEMWTDVLTKNNIRINEQEKVEKIEKQNEIFLVQTNKNHYTTKSVLLAIGRRGSPRKLNAPGEEKEKVYYRLLEPEMIHNQKILVVGGGDSAIESALLLADENNKVTLSYRGDSFSRLKPKNHEKINNASRSGKVKIILNSEVSEILDKSVILRVKDSSDPKVLENDIVYIFAGGILPTKFLEDIGIKITKKFGEAILKH